MIIFMNNSWWATASIFIFSFLIYKSTQSHDQLEDYQYYLSTLQGGWAWTIDLMVNNHTL